MYHNFTINLETKKDIIEIEWTVLNNPVLKYTSYYIDSIFDIIITVFSESRGNALIHSATLQQQYNY